MSDAYSYTTIAVEPGQAPHITVSLRPDGQMAVWCSAGHERAQISILHADAHVVITPTNPTVPTAGDVRAARKFAESFAVYAAEVERLHAVAQQAAESESSAD
ncbi:hypothetical protein Acsp04_55440 [Actinomadura sp. NBRC 104425]|uniref:hypothetical protein n=1 Tax=Actinomadura sp. NBRC 104425 TaxID=3032204 RepID=UPI0024A5CCC8|nr:hypothetical protein [Actinomadura sp. NBRC 104425]GLZ15309.1 hypothetical protein Acsp04_55440 [Actinomadura sp. NBRC 104425]